MTLSTFQALTSSESNEWYTPPEYTDSAAKVMGGIDLDPASNKQAQQWIQANRYYTQDDDGFNRSWSSDSIWLNMPYGKKNKEKANYGASAWVQKAIDTYKENLCPQIIILGRGDSKPATWLQENTICCISRRIAFLHPTDTEKTNPVPGTKIFYLGKNWHSFAEEFKQYGAIVTPNFHSLEGLQHDNHIRN